MHLSFSLQHNKADALIICISSVGKHRFMGTQMRQVERRNSNPTPELIFPLTLSHYALISHFTPDNICLQT